MSRRVAIAGFILTILATAYQLMSYSLAYLVNTQALTYIYLTYFGLEGVGLTTLVLFWAASNLINGEDRRRTAWPSIILAIGAANLGNLIIAWYVPNPSGSFLSQQTFPIGELLILLPAPLMLILGSIVSFVAVRRQPRQQVA